jgi:hypothetical protein
MTPETMMVTMDLFLAVLGACVVFAGGGLVLAVQNRRLRETVASLRATEAQLRERIEGLTAGRDFWRQNTLERGREFAEARQRLRAEADRAVTQLQEQNASLLHALERVAFPAITLPPQVARAFGDEPWTDPPSVAEADRRAAEERRVRTPPVACRVRTATRALEEGRTPLGVSDPTAPAIPDASEWRAAAGAEEDGDAENGDG